LSSALGLAARVLFKRSELIGIDRHELSSDNWYHVGLTNRLAAIIPCPAGGTAASVWRSAEASVRTSPATLSTGGVLGRTKWIVVSLNALGKITRRSRPARHRPLGGTVRHPEDRGCFVTNAQVFVGTNAVAGASNLDGTANLSFSAIWRITIEPCPAVFARTHIWGNAAATIGTRIDTLASHDRSLDPTPRHIGISNVVGMVGSNVPSGLEGKATVVDSSPVVIIVVPLLPLPTIAKEPIGRDDGLPIVIAELGPGVGSGGIVVGKIIVKTTLPAGAMVPSAKLRVPVIVSEGKGDISSQCKLVRIDLVISASHVAVRLRHFEMTGSTVEAFKAVGKVLGEVDFKATARVNGIVTASCLEAATIVGCNFLVIYGASGRIALEPAILSSTTKLDEIGCGWISF